MNKRKKNNKRKTIFQKKEKKEKKERKERKEKEKKKKKKKDFSLKKIEEEGSSIEKVLRNMFLSV
jgi:hypothetical protein